MLWPSNQAQLKPLSFVSLPSRCGFELLLDVHVPPSKAAQANAALIRGVAVEPRYCRLDQTDDTPHLSNYLIHLAQLALFDYITTRQPLT